MTNVKSTTLVGFVLLAAAGNAFITNGSFESGSAYGGSPSIWVAGTPAPWTATSYTPDMYDNTGADGWGMAGIAAYDNMMSGVTACGGNRFIGFAASTGFGGINEAFGQNVSGLVPGQMYTISTCMITDVSAPALAFGGPYNGYGHVDVYLNSIYLGTFTNNTLAKTWQARSFSFFAPATSGFLKFEAQLDNTSPVLLNSYMGLDDLQVVPEPASMIIVSSGVLALLRKRRK